MPSKEKEAVAAPSLTWSSSSSLRSNCLLPISCIILVKRKQGVMDEGQSFRQEGRSKRIVQSSAAIPQLRFKIFTLQTLPQIEDGFMEGISRGLFFLSQTLSLKTSEVRTASVEERLINVFAAKLYLFSMSSLCQYII